MTNLNDKNKIVSFCWLTGIFLAWLDGKKSTLYRDCFDCFNIPMNNMDNFTYFNQGTTLMLCYGLLVYPQEFWKNYIDFKKMNDFVLNNYKKNILELFEVEKNEGNEKINIEILLRHLRNSISHSTIEINHEYFKFIDINKTTKKKFVTKISQKDLGLFLHEMGSYFVSLDQNSESL